MKWHFSRCTAWYVWKKIGNFEFIISFYASIVWQFAFEGSVMKAMRQHTVRTRDLDRVQVRFKKERRGLRGADAGEATITNERSSFYSSCTPLAWYLDSPFALQRPNTLVSSDLFLYALPLPAFLLHLFFFPPSFPSSFTLPKRENIYINFVLNFQNI